MYCHWTMGDIETTPIFEDDRGLMGQDKFEAGELPGCPTILTNLVLTRNFPTNVLQLDGRSHSAQMEKPWQAVVLTKPFAYGMSKVGNACKSCNNISARCGQLPSALMGK